MEKEGNMRRSDPLPPTKTRGLRDVRDLEGYVSTTLGAIGIVPSSPVHEPLLRHGVRSAHRVERALPPEASLRPVLDEVLHQRLNAVLRSVRTPALAGPASA
jgi:hypothetical protein